MFFKKAMAPQTITVATQNPHKVDELRAFAQAMANTYPVLANIDFQPCTSTQDIDETGLTFRENACLKALATPPNRGSRWVLADDSGLVVPVLSGRDGLTDFPGVRSNRWLSEEKRNALFEVTGQAAVSTEDKNEALRLLMRGQSQRQAYYVCHLCMVEDETVAWDGQGRMALEIIRDEEEPSGNGGFGYDPIMHPILNGMVDSRTVADLSMAEKNALSHRGTALHQLFAWLQETI